MPKEKKQVYAVIRIDTYRASVEDQVTVKEIVPTLEAAQAEVLRLNELNRDQGCRYLWQATKLIPEAVTESTLPKASHSLIETIRSFPVMKEVEHCGERFSVPALEIYATCPRCGDRIKIRSFSGLMETEDVIDAVLQWLSRAGAQGVAKQRQAVLAEAEKRGSEDSGGDTPANHAIKPTLNHVVL